MNFIVYYYYSLGLNTITDYDSINFCSFTRNFVSLCACLRFLSEMSEEEVTLGKETILQVR